MSVRFFISQLGVSLWRLEVEKERNGVMSVAPSHLLSAQQTKGH
jgi:hypothetical protein